MLKKALVFLPIILLLSACGGGGGGTTSSATTSQAGIYTGTITPDGGTPDSAAGIITSNGKSTIVDADTTEIFIGTKNGNSITGTVYSTESVPMSAQITTVTGNNISGNYSSSLGNGTFALVANPNLYNRVSTLSKLEGVWVDDLFTNGIGTSTWVIDQNGAFTVNSTLGCTAVGDFFLIDPSKNEYEVDITINNCLSANGGYSGIAIITDTFNSNDTLSIVFNNGAVAGIFEPIKQ